MVTQNGRLVSDWHWSGIGLADWSKIGIPWDWSMIEIASGIDCSGIVFWLVKSSPVETLRSVRIAH